MACYLRATFCLLSLVSGCCDVAVFCAACRNSPSFLVVSVSSCYSVSWWVFSWWAFSSVSGVFLRRSAHTYCRCSRIFTGVRKVLWNPWHFARRLLPWVPVFILESVCGCLFPRLASWVFLHRTHAYCRRCSSSFFSCSRWICSVGYSNISSSICFRPSLFSSSSLGISGCLATSCISDVFLRFW